MVDKPLPWPTSGDVFFSDSDLWHNACVGWTYDDWYGYTEGYRRAAERLLAQVLEQGRGYDTLVYPIVFTARHYLEIKLKCLIVASTALLGNSAALTPSHVLTDSWRVLRPMLEEIFPGHGNGELDIVAALLKEFDSRDRLSMVFRYPVNVKGQPHHSKPATIGLATFQATFQSVATFLESCDSAIKQYLDYQSEYSG